MPAPVIGVTTRSTLLEKYNIPMVSSPRTYCDALVRAGAIPVLIPLNLPADRVAELLSKLDGVVFTGGGDIESRRFKGADHPKVYDVDEERDAVEFQLVREVMDRDKPFLGICRGLQVLNVANGGTLYTHILDQMPGALEHSYSETHPYDYRAHPVQVGEESRLAEIVSEPLLQVNSLHHQGVRDLAPNLKAVGHAPDGLIEAIELPGHRFGLAVQWHPEWLPEDADQRAILRALVEAAHG